jgi:hypothetical protein
MSTRAEMGVRVMLAALLLGAAAYVFFAFFLEPAEAADPAPRPGPDGPAPAEVSALIEEAKRITREATG